MIGPNSTRAIRIIGPGFSFKQFRSPADVFVTRTSIYIMDAWDYTVQKWSRNLTTAVIVAGISGVNATRTSMTTFSGSYNLFVDNYGNLYVSDVLNNRVLQFPWNSISGTRAVMIAGTGVAGSGPDQLYSPRGVFVTDDRIIYIADCGNHRIQKWTIGAASGVTVAGTGLAGSGFSQLNYPMHILVDLNGYMYIVEYFNNRVVRWAPGATVGECIAACSSYSGIAPSQLKNPNSITFDSKGSLYVNDLANRRVQKFEILDETGRVLLKCVLPI